MRRVPNIISKLKKEEKYFKEVDKQYRFMDRGFLVVGGVIICAVIKESLDTGK